MARRIWSLRIVPLLATSAILIGSQHHRFKCLLRTEFRLNTIKKIIWTDTTSVSLYASANGNSLKSICSENLSATAMATGCSLTTYPPRQSMTTRTTMIRISRWATLLHHQTTIARLTTTMMREKRRCKCPSFSTISILQSLFMRLSSRVAQGPTRMVAHRSKSSTSVVIAST